MPWARRTEQPPHFSILPLTVEGGDAEGQAMAQEWQPMQFWLS